LQYLHITLFLNYTSPPTKETGVFDKAESIASGRFSNFMSRVRAFHSRLEMRLSGVLTFSSIEVGKFAKIKTF